MKPFLVHVDHPQRPTRSSLILGPEADPNEVLRLYGQIRSSGVHESGEGFVMLHRGVGEPLIAQVRRESAWKTEPDQEPDPEPEAKAAPQEREHQSKKGNRYNETR